MQNIYSKIAFPPGLAIPLISIADAEVIKQHVWKKIVTTRSVAAVLGVSPSGQRKGNSTELLPEISATLVYLCLVILEESPLQRRWRISRRWNCTVQLPWGRPHGSFSVTQPLLILSDSLSIVPLNSPMDHIGLGWNQLLCRVVGALSV